MSLKDLGVEQEVTEVARKKAIYLAIHKIASCKPTDILKHFGTGLKREGDFIDQITLFSA